MAFAIFLMFSMTTYYSHLFLLLRAGFGQSMANLELLSAEEWGLLYKQASKQSLIGILYEAINRLPKGNRPPVPVLMRLAYEAEAVKGMNLLQNKEAARLTSLFVAEGVRTAVLKGQANSRLYPDPLIRQPGDIDLWVEGGRENVLALLKKMHFPVGPCSRHHVHLPKDANGVTVEIHYRASSGSRNPFANRRLQAYLNSELKNLELVPEGFYVPSFRFALVMQLSHIYQHLFGGGIGLRQLVDYYVLLQNASSEDREYVARQLRRLGLSYIAAAVMWVLQEVLALGHEQMLCEPDAYRGKWLLKEILSGGNFGFYDSRYNKGILRRWVKDRIRAVRFIPFDPVEVIWCEFRYWKATISLIPKRMRVGKLALGGR